MREKNRFRPSLGHLEARWTPSTVRLINGTAYVTNQVGALTVTGTALNTIKIADLTTQVTLTAPGGLFITGTEGANTITVNLNGNTFNGNVLVNALGGADSVTLDTNSGAQFFAGDVTVLSGTGSDTVNLGNVNAVAVSGNLSVIDGGGVDTINLGTAGGTAGIFKGTTQVVGFNTINIGGAPTTFGGPASFVSGGDTGKVTLGIAATTTFADDVQITTSTGNDSVTLTNADQGTLKAYAGSLTVDLGTGNNTLTTNAATTQTINGPLSIAAGAGADSVTIGANTKAQSNATISVGDGTNTIDLTAASAVNGNLTVNAGSGTDAITTFAVAVGGDINLNLGSGTNTFTPAGVAINALNYTGLNGTNTVNLTAATAVGAVRVDVGNGGLTFTGPTGVDITGPLNLTVGNGGSTTTLTTSVNGKFTANLGNGINVLNLGDAAGADFYNVNLNFGSANDTITFGANGFVSGTIDGGAGNNTGTQNGVTFVQPFTITNFLLS